ncbi:MAG: hypothetical protein JWQ89_2631 [Devosia sp.]|nr:hypothetical protein [Devosia sp.]
MLGVAITAWCSIVDRVKRSLVLRRIIFLPLAIPILLVDWLATLVTMPFEIPLARMIGEPRPLWTERFAEPLREMRLIWCGDDGNA